MTIALTGFTGGAKTVPGIPPVDGSRQMAGRHEVWKGAEPGAALRELDSRSPDRKLRSLIQEDGIVNYRPELLTGLVDPSASTSAIVSRLPMSKIPGGSNLCGFMAYNQLDLDYGVYRIPLSASQQLTQLRNTTGILSSFRGGASSDRYYVMSYYGTTVQNGVDQCLTAIFDKNDWKLLAEAGDYGQYERVCSDMTFDPTTQRFYGCFLNHNQSQWVLGYMQLDPSSPASTIGSVTALCNLEVSLNGLAADANGVLWGIRNDNGDLVKINRKTGEMTKVASTGLVPGYNGSLSWDNTNGILYWSVTYDDPTAPAGVSSAILTVNAATGALTHAYNFAAPAQTCGLYTEFTAAGATPGMFTGFSVAFEGESLSGTVKFDAPTALTDGSAASGSLTYTLSVVKDNGYVAYKQNHTCSYGDKNISVPLTLNNAGDYTFTVQGFNDAGNGYPVSESRYVGSDLPMTAKNLKLQYADGTLSATWDAVNSTIHGGYFNPDEVTYRLSLVQVDADGVLKEYPQQTVTENKASWQVDNTDALRGYQLSVTPVFGVNQGEVTTAPYQWFGYMQAPFDQTMTATIDGWTPDTPEKGSPWQKVFSSSGKGWAIPYYWGNANNAWLFSPAIRLEKGRYYTFSFKAWSSIVDHTLHVAIGREASKDAMTTNLVDTKVLGHTTLAKANAVTFGFECKETGIYYLGFNNDTKSDTYTNAPYMWVNNVTCDVAPDTAPAAPALDVNYDKAGAVTAAITVKAPAKTFNDVDLTTLDKVTLKCNGTVVKEWEDVAAGADLTCDYEGDKAGTYIFVAEAVYEGVAGVPAIRSVHLGMSVPVNPEWVEVKEVESTPGTVEVTWAPVSKGTNGQDIAAEAMKYNVMNVITNSYIQRDVTTQPFVHKICDPEEQSSLLVSVNAETSAGQSSVYGTYAKQSIMHVGKPYSLPVRETFADGLAHYSWSIVNQHSAYDRCSVVRTASELGDRDGNGDGYCLIGFVPYQDSQCSLYSGVIDIPADAHNPVLGFAVYRVNYNDGKDNDNSVVVSIIGSKDSGSLRPVRAGDQNYGWQYYYYDMSLFKGQKVNLLFTFQTKSYTSHYIDDIHFFDAPEKDLAVTALNIPAEADPDTKVRMSVTVSNLGTGTLPKEGATVELRRGDDDTLVDSRSISSLQPFQSISVTFRDQLNNSFDPEVSYKGVVVYDGDANTSNNSLEGGLSLRLSTKPAPRALDGDRNDEGFAALTWQAPDLTPSYPTYEIGFETSTEPSQTELEGFSTIDVDGNEVYGDLGISGPQGFTSFPHSTLAHSGNWMIVSPCNADGAAKEDWLISPKLSGAAQKISFYARTNWNAYESYTVLTSSTGCEKEDFTKKVLETTTTSNDWQLVEIEVPAGTLYFAIVSKADDTTNLIYLMLDDFTFEGADSNEGLVLAGYNTYRDNDIVEKVAPVEAWEDLQGNPGPHFYRVTADYGDRGESAPSNELFLFTRGTGVDGIDAATGKVYTQPGRIVVEGAEGAAVSVADLGGIVIASVGNASATETFRLASGVYLVTIDGASVKVIVR